MRPGPTVPRTGRDPVRSASAHPPSCHDRRRHAASGRCLGCPSRSSSLFHRLRPPPCLPATPHRRFCRGQDGRSAASVGRSRSFARWGPESSSRPTSTPCGADSNRLPWRCWAWSSRSSRTPSHYPSSALPSSHCPCHHLRDHLHDHAPHRPLHLLLSPPSRVTISPSETSRPQP